VTRTRPANLIPCAFPLVSLAQTSSQENVCSNTCAPLVHTVARRVVHIVMQHYTRLNTCYAIFPTRSRRRSERTGPTTRTQGRSKGEAADAYAPGAITGRAQKRKILRLTLKITTVNVVYFVYKIFNILLID
jgi:hypothetical protein